MSTPKFTPKPLPDDEIRLAQELCVEMGECAATYHIVIQLGEIERLRQINMDMYNILKIVRGYVEDEVKRHSGIDECDIDYRCDLECIDAALAKAQGEKMTR